MATDPTRSIRAHDHPSVFDYPADELLNHLANLPSQYEVPYLTVTLDWSVDGDNPARSAAPATKRSQPAGETGTDRPSLRIFEQEMNRLIEAHGPRGAAFDALQQSKERIGTWLRDELDPAARGVYIVAHEPSGVLDATGLNLKAFFNQYLRDTRIPKFVYKMDNGRIQYRWEDVVPGFEMPVLISKDNRNFEWIKPTSNWQSMEAIPNAKGISIDPNFYVEVQQLGMTKE